MKLPYNAWLVSFPVHVVAHTKTHIINDNMPLQVLAACLSQAQKSSIFFVLKKKMVC